jgi:GntR family transcriptional regulator / MocR family aminotransferase
MGRPVTPPSLLDIGIDRRDTQAIQAQIAHQIRDMVLQGRLKPQSRLPSSRALAEDLGVARATVVAAFEQLNSEGYIETQRGSATRIATELPETLLNTQRAASRPAQSDKGQTKRKPARPFRFGLVDWEHFPHDDWGRLLGRYWRNPPISLLELDDTFGWPPLRQAIARHLFEWRGIRCNAQHVIVTSGGVDAFDIIHRALLGNGDTIWLEEPGYPTARRVFSLGGVRVAPIPVDADGLVVSEGCKHYAKAKGAFVTPARHYPTGVTMPLARRLELLNWARESGAFVIEDDYDSEYRYVGKPLPSLTSLADSLPGPVRVIYSGTFSKVFSPLVRLAFLVVPPDLIDVFRGVRVSHGAPPSLMVQPALAEFMQSGAFAIHIRRMRRVYADRRAVLISSLTALNSSAFEIDAAPSGLTVLLRLNGSISDENIAASLSARGVEVQTLSSHFGSATAQQGLLLSFAGFSSEALQKGAKAIGACLDEIGFQGSARKTTTRAR